MQLKRKGKEKDLMIDMLAILFKFKITDEVFDIKETSYTNLRRCPSLGHFEFILPYTIGQELLSVHGSYSN